MKENKKSPEELREELQQQERKKTPAGNARDAMQRAQVGGFTDLAGSLGWKGLGILILVLVVGVVIAAIVVK